MSKNCIIRCFDIIYNRDEQEKRIEKAITTLLSIEDIRNNAESLKDYLLSFIKTYALAFKRDCFKHENETRIILKVPKNRNKFFPIKYRVSNSNIVQYVEYEFNKRDMTGVTIGPLINAKVTQSTLWQFLKHNGYRFDDIRLSEIPIRF